MPNLKTSQETLRSPIDGTELVRLATPGANWQAPLSAFSRLRLPATTTYFVDPVAGNDNNTGLTSGTAFRTVQGAWNYLVKNVDGVGQFVAFHLADGTYSPGAGVTFLQMSPAPLGLNAVFIEPTSGITANCIVDLTGSAEGVTIFDGGCHCAVNFFNMTFINSDASRVAMIDLEATSVVSFQSCAFNMTNAHWVAFVGHSTSELVLNSCSISGSYDSFIIADERAFAVSFSNTFVGTPSFVNAIYDCRNHSEIIAGSVTGSATGARYYADQGGVINVWQGGLLSQPGNSLGTITEAGVVNYLDSVDSVLHRYQPAVSRTFANLTATPYLGQEELITNSTVNTWGSTIAGGGAFTVWGKWNGTNWTVVAL